MKKGIRILLITIALLTGEKLFACGCCIMVDVYTEVCYSWHVDPGTNCCERGISGYAAADHYNYTYYMGSDPPYMRREFVYSELVSIGEAQHTTGYDGSVACPN